MFRTSTRLRQWHLHVSTLSMASRAVQRNTVQSVVPVLAKSTIRPQSRVFSGVSSNSRTLPSISDPHRSFHTPANPPQPIPRPFFFSRSTPRIFCPRALSDGRMPSKRPMSGSFSGQGAASKTKGDSDTGEHPANHQTGSGTEGKHAWKTKPPYSIHENDDFEAKLEASCHCGKVTYQLSRDKPLDSKFCHCTTCQTQHAAPFQWAAIFHKTDINFTGGHHNLEWYDPTDKSIEHRLPCKVRCHYCHSPIMDEGRNMILLFPTLIKFKNKEAKDKFKPRLHMFYGERAVDIPDGLPKWTGLNDTSDLMADSPAEMVKELTKKREEEARKKEQNGHKEQNGNKD